MHYAKLQNLTGVDEIVDAYNAGDADFHQVVADMAGIERKQAKTINLGLMYGMGKNKLMAELGLMKESAEKLIRQYHSKAPFVKQLWIMYLVKQTIEVRLELYWAGRVISIFGNQFNLVYLNHYRWNKLEKNMTSL